MSWYSHLSGHMYLFSSRAISLDGRHARISVPDTCLAPDCYTISHQGSSLILLICLFEDPDGIKFFCGVIIFSYIKSFLYMFRYMDRYCVVHEYTDDRIKT